MTTTYTGAIDDIFKIFEDAWLAGSAAIVAYVPEIRWQGKEKEDKSPVTKYWVRVSTQTVIDKQSAMNSQTNGKRRYRTEGLVTVQLFCPKTDKLGHDNGNLLAELARSAFRGKRTPGGVSFYDARIVPLPPDGDAFKFNIVSNYRYAEIG